MLGRRSRSRPKWGRGRLSFPPGTAAAVMLGRSAHASRVRHARSAIIWWRARGASAGGARCGSLLLFCGSHLNGPDRILVHIGLSWLVTARPVLTWTVPPH